MTSVIAIVGRPNVGKSSVFNLLIGSNTALVADYSGLTRDRQYGNGKKSSAILIDTGGISSDHSNLSKAVLSQTDLAIEEADILFFVVDCKEGLLNLDQKISEKLRKTNKPIYLIINKVDNLKDDIKAHEFAELGFHNSFGVSIAHNLRTEDLRDLIIKLSPPQELNETNDKSLKISLIGRPNVGKSTLTNKLCGEERVLVSSESGTTRDSIEVPIQIKGKFITLVDTAGIRKKSSINEPAEKFSVSKSIEAIKKSHVVIHLIDSEESLVDQDMHLLGLALSLGRPVILAPNKIDLLDGNQKKELKINIDGKINFARYIIIHSISAKTGYGINSLLELVEEAYISSTKDLDTNLLNKILIKATQKQPPPLTGRFRPKLKYVHQGGKNPPVIVIHGNNLKKLPNSYKKYIENYFRKGLHLMSTPLSVVFLEGKNPFKDRLNKLTDKQKKKRQRLIKKNKR